MALSHNPRIVADGLVLCLDAANPKSYSGSGTTWYDLSKTKQNYTMYGTVPFSNDGKGSFDFSGLASGTSSSSPLGFTSTFGIPFGTTDSITVISWIKQTTNSSQTGLYSNAGGGDGIRFGPASGGIYYLIGPSYKEGVIGSSSFNLNEWVMICGVFDRQSTLDNSPYVYGYINGEFVGKIIQNSQTSMTTTSPGIVRSSCCQRFIGYLSNIIVYNKALTENEIKKNFNALKGRYI